MSKLIQVASAIALATTTGALFAAPPQALGMTQEQQQAMVEQQSKAMEQAIAAQRQFIEQRAANFRPLTRHPFAADHSFPEVPPMPEFGQYPNRPDMPPMPEFGQYPAMPEMSGAPAMERPAMPEFGQYPNRPPMPEFGQYPSMPEMPAFPAMDRPALPESFNARVKEMDAQRAQARQQMEERRAAMKSMREQRRAMYQAHGFGTVQGLPCEQIQATAPAVQPTTKQ